MNNFTVLDLFALGVALKGFQALLSVSLGTGKLAWISAIGNVIQADMESWDTGGMQGREETPSKFEAHVQH